MAPNVPRLLLLAILTAVALPAFGADPDLAALRAPTRLHPEPASYMLLPMGGDRVFFRYTPGSLDRSANLQYRLELAARGFERWSGERVEVHVFVLDRQEWTEAGFTVEYGIPVRVGKVSLAVPAEGDPGTVALWSAALDGKLPQIAGTPLRGTPEEVSSLLISDVFTQLLLCEILVDTTGLAGDDFWVRGVMTQLVSYLVAVRMATDQPESLALLYEPLRRFHAPRTVSVRDYDHDLGLADWLYFQSHFHFGARAIFEQAGKESLAKVRKVRKKNGGVLTGEDLERKFEGLAEWRRTSFAAVSMKK